MRAKTILLSANGARRKFKGRLESSLHGYSVFIFGSKVLCVRNIFLARVLHRVRFLGKELICIRRFFTIFKSERGSKPVPYKLNTYAKRASIDKYLHTPL